MKKIFNITMIIILITLLVACDESTTLVQCNEGYEDIDNICVQVIEEEPLIEESTEKELLIDEGMDDDHVKEIDINETDTLTLQCSDDDNDYNTTELIKKLSTEFDGRMTGTDGYVNSACLVSSIFEKTGMTPLFNADNFLQTYYTQYADVKEISLSVNGNELELMRDFMPFSRTRSVDISLTDFVFVQDGLEDKYNVDVKNKLVVFSWYDNNGDFPAGILDRLLIAQEKGALAALIITNGELKVGNYEHPIKVNEDNHIPAMYISEEVSREFLKITNYDLRTFENNAEVDLFADIKFYESSPAANVVGVVEGKNPGRSIMFISNLDGFGKIEDIEYQSTSNGGVVSAATFIDLAKYYSNNKPEYTIIFALVGDKYTSRTGIDELARILDFEKIITTIDIYSLGGIGELNKIILSDNKNISLFDDMEYYTFVNPGLFGNAISSTLSNYTHNMLFLRDRDTWFDNSREDIYNRITQRNYLKSIEELKKIVETIEKNTQVSEFKYTTVNEDEYYSETDKIYRKLESRYFSVLYDKTYSEIENIEFLKDIDTIYENVSEFNYYPVNNTKVKMIISEDHISAAIICGRDDVVNGHNVGGGFANTSKTNPCIYLRGPSLYTAAHEFNHLAHELSDRATVIGTNGEASGHVWIMKSHENHEDVASYINRIENTEFGPLTYITKNLELFNWNWMYDTNTVPKLVESEFQHFGQYAYFIYASMYDYLKFNFNENIARRANYRVFDNQEMVADIFAKETGLTSDEFLVEWSRWINSDGFEGYKKITENKITQYDWYKIFCLKDSKNVDEDESWKNSTVLLNDAPIITKNMIGNFQYTDDGNEYLPIDVLAIPNESSGSVSNLGVAQDDYNFYFKFNYINKENAHNISVVLAGFDGDFMLTSNVIKSGENTIIFKVSKQEFSAFDQRIMLALGDKSKDFYILNYEVSSDIVSEIDMIPATEDELKVLTEKYGLKKLNNPLGLSKEALDEKIERELNIFNYITYSDRIKLVNVPYTEKKMLTDVEYGNDKSWKNDYRMINLDEAINISGSDCVLLLGSQDDHYYYIKFWYRISVSDKFIISSDHDNEFYLETKILDPEENQFIFRVSKSKFNSLSGNIKISFNEGDYIINVLENK